MTTELAKWLLLLALAFAAMSVRSDSWTTKDSWTGEDKALHAVGGAAIGMAGTLVFKQAWYGFGLGCAVGIGKEFYDQAHPQEHTASYKDAATTCLGSALGAWLGGWVLSRDDGRTVVSYSKSF